KHCRSPSRRYRHEAHRSPRRVAARRGGGPLAGPGREPADRGRAGSGRRSQSRQRAPGPRPRGGRDRSPGRGRGAGLHPGEPPAARGGQAARVAPPSVSDTPVSIDSYLAAHAAEAAQSQAPRITVTWDRADIQEVVAGFAAFSGRTIVVNKGISGSLSAEIKNQPWDLAFNAVLESQGLTVNTLEGGILQVIDKK